jgi:hypothetical protein
MELDTSKPPEPSPERLLSMGRALERLGRQHLDLALAWISTVTESTNRAMG